MSWQELAYKFYPKGVFENTPEYLDSIEHRNFEERKTRTVKKHHKKWTQLVKELQNDYGWSNVSNFDYYLNSTEKSFPVCISLLTEDHKKIKNLVLHVSTLIDFYVVYQSDPNIGSFVQENQYASFNIEENLVSDYLKIKESTSKYFPKFSEFPKNLLNIEIPDIMHDGVGIFDDSSLNLLEDYRTKMTAYKAFFSSRFFFNSTQ